MTSQTEIELKFLVPAASRAGIATEMARGAATPERMSLAARYLDTDDRRLAQERIAWRLRREGRGWIQTLKAGGANALERFEHEVVRPDASHDASQHAGTPVGDRLIAILRRASADGLQPAVRFETEVRRTARRVRTRGAVVEVAFDEGRLLAAGSSQRIREIEFELIAGSSAALLTLAERWRRRFGLIYDPRSKSKRGDRLAEGSPFPPLRKAGQPRYPDDATAAEAFAAVLDECLAQITRNAIGLIEGDPGLRVEHVHQLRVGIRRIRSAQRCFQGWAPSPPADLVEGLRSLFAALGMARDSDVLDSGVMVDLAKVGAPRLTLPAGHAGPDPVKTVRAADSQQTFLAWIAWRATLADEPGEGVDAIVAGPQGEASSPAAGDAQASDVRPSDGGPHSPHRTETGAVASQTGHDDAPTFHRDVERRLRQWHRRIIADSDSFDELDEAGLHALRKRIKRQRYAVEFFAPVLRRRKAARYLNAVAAMQDRMGELNDLFVARARYQSLVESDPAAWFALGWLAARIAQVCKRAKRELGQLAKADPPTS